MTKNTDIEITTEVLPEFLQNQENIPGGLQDMGTEDTLVPRIAIGQALTTQVEQDLVPKGCLFDTSTDEVLAIEGESLTVCILSWVKNYIEWEDRETGGGIIASEQPGGDLEKRARSGEKNNKDERAITEYQNYVVALVFDGFVRLDLVKAVSMCRTGLKHAKRLNSMLQRRDSRIFVGLWYLTTEKETNRKKQSYYVAKWKPAGWIPESQYSEIMSLHRQLEEGKDKIVIQIDEHQDKLEDVMEGETSTKKNF